MKKCKCMYGSKSYGKSKMKATTPKKKKATTKKKKVVKKKK